MPEPVSRKELRTLIIKCLIKWKEEELVNGRDVSTRDSRSVC